MRRIGLAVVLAVNLLAVPVAPEAQQGTKVPRVGLLDYAAFRDPLLEMLRDLVSRSSLIIAVFRAAGAPSCPPDEHEQLVTALERREPRAVNLMHEHLDPEIAALDREFGLDLQRRWGWH